MVFIKVIYKNPNQHYTYTYCCFLYLYGKLKTCVV